VQEAIKAEMEKKRKARELEFGGKKYARLADIEAIREVQSTPGARGGAAAAGPSSTAAEVRGRARNECSVARRVAPSSVLSAPAPSLAGHAGR
jgi:hypothetical protein